VGVGALVEGTNTGSSSTSEATLVSEINAEGS
jgi:hypothetical protein